MSNPFSTENLVPNWSGATSILKGDLPGHEFHGNQYATLGQVLGQLDEIKNIGSQPNSRNASNIHADAAYAHRMAREEHDAAATKAKSDLESAKTPEERKDAVERINAHSLAADLHNGAISAHAMAANEHELFARGNINSPIPSQSATYDAIRASEHAQEASDIANGKVSAPSPREYYMADEGMGGTRP